MIIHLKKSVLFTVSPDERFCQEYNVHPGFWKDIWRRYKLLTYTQTEVRDFYRLKTGNHITAKTISLWIFRSEIYSMTSPLMKEGVQAVNSSFFRDYEWRLIKELTKNVRRSANKKVKTIV